MKPIAMGAMRTPQMSEAKHMGSRRHVHLLPPVTVPELPLRASARRVRLMKRMSAEVESHVRKVRSLAKKVLGSTRVRTCNFTCITVVSREGSRGF